MPAQSRDPGSRGVRPLRGCPKSHVACASTRQRAPQLEGQFADYSRRSRVFRSIAFAPSPGRTRVIIGAVTAWWNQLVTASPPSARATLAVPGVADRMAAELAAAHVRWPEATVTDTAFAAVLAARLATQKDPAAALARLRVEDLFLAQWCATGDARAIAAFERVHQGDLDAVLARFRRLAITDDELRQVLRIKLFVAAGERPARIGEYS